MPEPSAELVLIGVFVRAFLRSAHLKSSDRREAFLHEVEASFALFEQEARIPRLRAPINREALAEARAQAAEWYRAMFAILAG